MRASTTRPYARIEEGEGELAATLTLSDGTTTTIRGYRKRAIFHGRSHKPILEDQAKGISWSSAVATYAEVRSILGRLRASKMSASRPKLVPKNGVGPARSRRRTK